MVPVDHCGSFHPVGKDTLMFLSASPQHHWVMSDCFPQGSESSKPPVVMKHEWVEIWLTGVEESGIWNLERGEVKDRGQVGGLGSRAGHSYALFRKFFSPCRGSLHTEYSH